MFRLDKRKIFLLYQHYLLGKMQEPQGSLEKEQERITWFSNCLKKEKKLSEIIAKKLKTGWDFSRLPPLEKAVLTFATYELLFHQNPERTKMIIDQTINFSKVYLEEGKYKYINKILDLLGKENSKFGNKSPT